MGWKTDHDREEVPSHEAQLAWLQSLRPRTAHIEFVFNDGDEGHPLLDHLGTDSSRTVGVGAGNGYARPRPNAVKRRFAYDRAITRAIEDLGGFFPEDPNPDPLHRWTGLGDVDVIFRDEHDHVLGATVTHEGLIITPSDPEG
ncbi:hypothetical protein ACQCX5_07430 [Propionibacteriaceae bacterium G57]|uniref:hypothetical protein n=1 Tax=Aestuariimicrobium sp. G57 TaxID=3418485 RepID=UPI003DA75F95